MGTKFKHIPPPTGEEEAEIQRQIASDPDAPEATDEELAYPMTFAEALPEMAEALRKRLGGRPRLERPKQGKITGITKAGERLLAAAREAVAIAKGEADPGSYVLRLPEVEASAASLTDEEEAELERQIAPDPDDFELTGEMAANRMTLAEAFPDLTEKIRRKTGVPVRVRNRRSPSG